MINKKESWDQSFKYSFKNKLKNLFHPNILQNKNYISFLKQEQYNSFCRKCIQNFDITNNHSIKNYNFYHPNNIFITDLETFDVLEEFT